MTTGKIITPQQLPVSLQSKKSLPAKGLPIVAASEVPTYKEAREEFEREFLLQKLEENDWNISRTAEAIEMERSNLHRKIKSFGIELQK